jgi:hypothetical protein
MTKSTLEAEAILKRAAPLTHQQAHEIQPFGHLVRMPIALSEQTCKESVDNLNQLLADTITLRDLYKKHHWQVAGPTFYQLHHSPAAEGSRRGTGPDFSLAACARNRAERSTDDGATRG